MSAAAASALRRSRARARAAGIVATVRRRPRLLLCAALAVVILFILPSELRLATRGLIAWNVGALVFIASISRLMRHATSGSIREHAAQENEEPWALLVIAIVAAAAAITAIVFELGPVKDMTGWMKASHIALVAITILSAWSFTHLMFALHYASEYWAETPDPSDGSEVRRGLKFPGDEEPGWTDFLYQAFVIGCACATADVNTTTRTMRVVCAVQGVVAFFFNTFILAMTINIGAGFV